MGKRNAAGGVHIFDEKVGENSIYGGYLFPKAFFGAVRPGREMSSLDSDITVGLFDYTP